MFEEADPPKRRSDTLGDLLREDLDRLSIGELDARIAALEGEITRTRAKLSGATQFRSAAEGLFRK